MILQSYIMEKQEGRSVPTIGYASFELYRRIFQVSLIDWYNHG